MGCGASSNVVPGPEAANGHGGKSTRNGVGNGRGDDRDGHDSHDSHDILPTVVLTESPVKPKPPIAFEIPLEEFEGGKQSSPPAHLQRLLQPPQPEISLPDIEEKLAEAEQRRLSILHQRAASAQKRAQKIMKAVLDLDRPGKNNDMDPMENGKHGPNTLTIPPAPGAMEDKNIT